MEVLVKLYLFSYFYKLYLRKARKALFIGVPTF